MIIEIEDRFCKAAKVFSEMLNKVQRAAERGDAVHEVEEMTWGGLIETGREMVVAFIQEQEEELPRPEVIEHEGKQLQRLPERRVRSYVSAFGPTPFATRRLRHAGNATPGGGAVGRETRHAGERYVVPVAEVERHAVREGIVPGIAGHAAGASWALPRRSTAWKIWRRRRPSMPMSTSSSRHRWIRRRRRRSSWPRAIAKACRCERSMRRGTKQDDDAPRRKRLKKGEKNGQKRMACVGGVYSVAPFRRTVEDVLNEILRKEKQEQRPKPQNKRLRAVLTREVDGKEVNAKDVVFDWLAKELQQRDPHEQRTVVAVMDGETKLRDLQELKIGRAIGILDIWHVTEYLWELAYCFYRDGSDEAEAFVETYLRKLLEGKVNRVIGGIRQMATKRELPKPKWEKVEDCLTYFAARC